ncbi:MAG TPA: Gfo/Idh/MocA family oxidoreductase [Pyrinomonadaceae bacterium]|jgi:predicted dehydrogenase
MAIRVGVVGAGARGRDWVREIRADSAYELAACVDTDDETLRQAAQSLRLPPALCFSDLAQALDRSPCDAVIVATPADAHTEASELALGRGIGVMVEKPFTLCLKEAARLVALSEQKRIPLLVAQNYRYMRAHRAVRRLILDGTLGRVAMVTCQYYRVPHEMPPSLYGLPHSVLWGMGVHHIDALRYVLGQEVTGVMARSFTAPWNELPKGASLQTLLTFDGGTHATYTATYEASGHEFFERGQEFYQRVVGERATLHVFQRWLILCERGKWPRLVNRGARARTEESTLLRQFERALVDGEAAESSGRDNLKTVAVLEAVVRSSGEGRWVNPQELLDGLD